MISPFFNAYCHVKELCMAKTGGAPNLPPLCGIEQNDSLTCVTLQNDGKFSSHGKGKLQEAEIRESQDLAKDFGETARS